MILLEKMLNERGLKPSKIPSINPSIVSAIIHIEDHLEELARLLDFDGTPRLLLEPILEPIKEKRRKNNV